LRYAKELGLVSYSLRALYKVVGVTEQSVSQHRARTKARYEHILRINEQVIAYKNEHPGCGRRKLYYQINPDGIGRDSFIQILRQLGFGANRKRNVFRTTIPGYINYPNYIEGLLVARINHVWQSDITWFILGKEHYYLIFIIDVYSKAIVGHAVSKTMHARNNLKCLKKALRSRKITRQTRMIHHSDRGSQFSSIAYTSELLKKNIRISMGIKGQDNAYAERINGTIKNEYLHFRTIENFTSLQRWTKQAVDHYNEKRIHDHLPGKMSPNMFEEKLLNLSHQERPKVIIYADGNKAIKEDQDLLSSLTKKGLQDHICPIEVNY